MAAKERFVQVGQYALRDPRTGGFLPAVPLYAREGDLAPKAEEQLIEDIGALFAEKIKAYKEGCREAGVSA